MKNKDCTIEKYFKRFCWTNKKIFGPNVQNHSQKSNFKMTLEDPYMKEKPYSCTQCIKSFSRDELLKQHMRMYTGEKPYTCTQCTKSFLQDADL